MGNIDKFEKQILKSRLFKLKIELDNINKSETERIEEILEEIKFVEEQL